MGAPVPPGVAGPALPAVPPPYSYPPPVPPGPYTAAYGSGPGGNAAPTFTLIHNVAQGDALVVAAASNSGTAPPLSVTDSQNNSYQLVSIDTNRSPNVALFAALDCNPMTASFDTITVTFGAVATVKNVIVRGYSNVATEFAVDQVAAPQDANNTAPSISSAALGYSQEWVLVPVVNGANGGVPPQGSWTGGFSPVMTVGPGPYLTLAEQLVTSPAAVSTSNTVAANGWSALLVSLAPVPMVNPLSGLPPPGLIPPLAWQQFPVPDTMQGAPPAAGAATLAAAGSIDAAAAVQAAPASLSAAGSVDASSALQAPAVLGAAGSVTAPAVQQVPASLAGAGSVAAPAVQQAPAALGGAGSITASAGGTGAGTLGGAGAVAAPAVQAVPAALAGAGSVTSGAVAAAGASLPGTGALAALAAQRAAASLAAAGSVTGTALSAVPFTIGLLTATAAPGASLTAAGAPLGILGAAVSASALTAAVAPGNAVELHAVQDERLGELFDEGGGQAGA